MNTVMHLSIYHYFTGGVMYLRFFDYPDYPVDLIRNISGFIPLPAVDIDTTHLRMELIYG